MKFLTSSCFRAICILLLGVLLVMNPDKTTELLVVIVGFAFLVPSIVALIGYLAFISRTKTFPNGYRPRIPVMEIGSLLFGLVLIFLPHLFITILMYVLGALLVIFASNQIINLVVLRNLVTVPLGFYVVPGLILIAGIVMLIDPIQIAGSPFLILGICCIVSGVSDLINLYKFRKARRANLNKVYNEQQIEQQ